MKVFCAEHNRGFFTPRQNPITCENRGHILGELDFEGNAQAPPELRWQYCCNCEHFFPVGFGQNGIERCPACARPSSTRYLCDRCYTISFESNTPAATKNFTLTPEGMPHPSCPACLRSPSGDLSEHECDGLGASFFTALTTCPICRERLDIAPSFPAAVAYYLKRTRNKLNVTFDYDSELFLPAEDGEFVLVRNGNEAGHEFMLPRTPCLSTKRDFYDRYQDYYYCADPVAGEVQVVQPAIVDRVSDGWKLKTHGVLEVIVDAKFARSKQVKAGEREKVKAEAPPTRACPHCNNLVEAKYAFCWHCGKSIGTREAAPIRSSEETKSVDDSLVSVAEDEITLFPEANTVQPGPSIFAWALEERAVPASISGATIKLIAVAIIGLALVSFLLFVVLGRPASTLPNDVTSSQPTDDGAQPVAGSRATDGPVQSALAAQPGPAAQTSATVPSADSRPDFELKKLQQERTSVLTSDRAKITETLAAAEKRYPNDYRFPYERARLSINPQEINSHHEAFSALRLAAQKAIENGKADEMLSSLMADEHGDFHKLSHGHGEWRQLEEALKNKDKRVLSAKLHH
jgi:hypothetical protein